MATDYYLNRFERCSIEKTTTYNRVRVVVFNATFNNISVRSWRSVLLVEETGENHRHDASH